MEPLSLRLFRWQEGTRSLVLVATSGVDPERRIVWGIVDEPGVYGAIGLPSDPDQLRTMAAFSLFSAAELRETPALITNVCGLILCVPGVGGGPPGGRLCQQCLGLEVPELHFPEVQLLRARPGKIVDVAPPVALAPSWPAALHDRRNTCQSALNGPANAPSVLWSFYSDGLDSPVVAGDGTVYVTDGGRKPPDLFALDGNTGQAKWSVRLAATAGVSGWRRVALDPRGRIYTSDGDGGITAISPNGSVEWIHVRPGKMLSGPIVGSNGQVYAVSADPFSYVVEGVLALDASGREVWAAPFSVGQGNSWVSVAGRDDGSIIVADRQNVWALEPTGQARWRAPLSDGSSIAVANDGRIVVPNSRGGAVRVLDANGARLPDLPALGQSFAIAANGVCYFSNRSNVPAPGSLDAVDPGGNIVWSRLWPAINPQTTVRGTPAIGADGLVYFKVGIIVPGSGEVTDVHALDPATGQDVWVLRLPGPFGPSGLNPAIAPGRTLLVTDSSGRLWALR